MDEEWPSPAQSYCHLFWLFSEFYWYKIGLLDHVPGLAFLGDEGHLVQMISPTMPKGEEIDLTVGVFTCRGP
jgi:hypothetical protein